MHGPPPSKDARTAPEGSGLRVLLVSGSPEERRFFIEILRSRGHTVTSCRDTESAWEAYRTDPHPLVLLDRVVRGTDGLELCRRIRRSPGGGHCVIIVATGQDEPDDLEAVLDAGADDYIAKPVDVALLKVRLAVAERDVANPSFPDGMRPEAALRKSERELRALAEQLQQANHELEAFAYSVSHDLRAPLRTMQGFAHALLEDCGEALTPQARDYAGRILLAGERTERLISDLLAYSRLGFEEVRLEPVELDPVVTAALEQVDADLTETGARIDVAEGLPRVLGDRVTLTQVLANLLSNAIKFVPEGTRPDIRIRAEPHPGSVRLWVEDNGVGIPVDQQDRIFRTFERLAQSRGRPGTGIGLAIVRRGIERIGGRAGVESEPGKGARFWIEIPEPAGAPDPRAKGQGEA